MIARPVNRPRPIPFATPAPGDTATRPVSWASSSGPAQQEPALLAPFKAPLPAMPPAPRPSMATARRSPVMVSAFRDDPGPIEQGMPARPTSQASARPVKPAPVKDATELSARFIGQGALSVRSSVTGRHYRFQGHGDRQKIDKNDLMMLRRIPDLVVE